MLAKVGGREVLRVATERLGSRDYTREAAAAGREVCPEAIGHCECIASRKGWRRCNQLIPLGVVEPEAVIASTACVRHDRSRAVDRARAP